MSWRFVVCVFVCLCACLCVGRDSEPHMTAAPDRDAVWEGRLAHGPVELYTILGYILASPGEYA